MKKMGGKKNYLRVPPSNVGNVLTLFVYERKNKTRNTPRNDVPRFQRFVMKLFRFKGGDLCTIRLYFIVKVTVAHHSLLLSSAETHAEPHNLVCDILEVFLVRLAFTEASTSTSFLLLMLYLNKNKIIYFPFYKKYNILHDKNKMHESFVIR